MTHNVQDTQRNSVDLPQDISSGMQHQMDLMESTFLLFLLLFFSSLLSCVSFSSSTFRYCLHTLPTHRLSSASPRCHAVISSSLNPHTLPHVPFVYFCEMFAFLNSLGHYVFGGCYGGGHARNICWGKYSVVYRISLISMFSRCLLWKREASSCAWIRTFGCVSVCVSMSVYQCMPCFVLVCWNRAGMCNMLKQVTATSLLAGISSAVQTHTQKHIHTDTH